MTTTLTGVWSAVNQNGALVYTSQNWFSSYVVSGDVSLMGATLIVTGGATVSGINGTSATVSILDGGKLQDSTISAGAVNIMSGGALINNAYHGNSYQDVFAGHIYAGGVSISDEFYATGTYESSYGSAFTIDSGATLSQATIVSGSFVQTPKGAIVDDLRTVNNIGVSLSAAYGATVGPAPGVPSYIQTFTGIWDAKLTASGALYLSVVA